MDYRAFDSDEDQIAAEAAAPDRFSDGSGWLRLAQDATTRGAAKVYSPSEWQQLIGGEALPVGERITAASVWELFRPYEAERLQADWVTVEGVAALKSYQQELYLALRAASEPAAVLGYRFAIDVIEQALVDPDRRQNFIQLARKHDALGVQLYRAAAPVAAQSKYRSIKSLKPGACMFVDDLIPAERTRIPWRGYTMRWWEGKRQVCRDRPISWAVG